MNVTDYIKGMDMSENLQIDLKDSASSFDGTIEGSSVKIIPSSDGKSLIIALSDFVANPGPYAKALQSITTRPVQLQFV